MLIMFRIKQLPHLSSCELSLDILDIAASLKDDKSEITN